MCRQVACGLLCTPCFFVLKLRHPKGRPPGAPQRGTSNSFPFPEVDLPFFSSILLISIFGHSTGSFILFSDLLPGKNQLTFARAPWPDWPCPMARRLRGHAQGLSPEERQSRRLNDQLAEAESAAELLRWCQRRGWG